MQSRTAVWSKSHPEKDERETERQRRDYSILKRVNIELLVWTTIFKLDCVCVFLRVCLSLWRNKLMCAHGVHVWNVGHPGVCLYLLACPARYNNEPGRYKPNKQKKSCEKRHHGIQSQRAKAQMGWRGII